MARTVRNPLENRTPVRTISSVMRNAPRQNFRPTQLGFDDFGGYGYDGFDGGYGRPDRGYGGQQRTPINQAVTSVVRPAGGSQAFDRQPAGGTQAFGRPAGGIQTTGRQPAGASGQAIAGGAGALRPAAGGKTATSVTSAGSKAPVTSVVKPAGTTTKPAATTKTTTPTKTTTAVKPTTPTTKTPTSAVKPVTSTTTKTPTSPVKPITSTTTKTPTSPVKPITSTTGTTPKTTTPKTSVGSTPKTSTGSNLTSTLLKTAAGAGAGALLTKLLSGGPKTGGTGTVTTGGGTTGRTGTTTTTGGRPAGIPVSGGTKPATKTTTAGGTTKPTTGGTKPTGGTTAKTAEEIKAENPELTDEEVQAELDRVKAEEESLGVPEGAEDNGDGTYSVTEDGMVTTYDKDGNVIGMEAADTTTAGEGVDTTVAGQDTTGADTTNMTDLGEGYFQDASGNIYSASGDLMYAVGDDGSYYDPSGDLIYDPNADTTVAEQDTSIDGADTTDTTVAENSWTDPVTGETWNLGADGSWSLEGDTTDYTDYADNTDNTDYTDDTVVAEDNTDSGDDYEVKKGGAIRRKTKGGLPRFADGDVVYSDTSEEVQPWQNVDYNYGESDDPTLTGYTLTGDINPVGNTYSRSATVDDSSSDGSSSADFMPTPGIQYFDDGSYIQTFDDGSTITVDSDGNIAGTTDAYQTTVDDYGNTIVTDGYGNMTVYDPNGNVVPTGGGRVTSAGSGRQTSYAAAQAAADRAAGNTGGGNDTGILDALKGYITQNPGLAGGAIGALISSLMDQAQSSESAGPSQPVDISALTSFGPRTTDFGPGMTGGRTGTGSPIVSYADYAEGYGPEEPDDRLYSDLGISGWLREPDMSDYRDESGNLTDRFGNPVDELGYLLNDGSGNYADESAVAEEETPAEDSTEVAEEPAMASGGPTTHYTFGRVIDPAENLGIAQGMKKGGLSQAHTVHSHHTNPVIDNRVDFRHGSAVNGAGDGQSDDIPAWLADGEYVMDAELVSMLGNGSNKAGAKVLDKFREEVRAHKRSAPLGKIPPKAKSPLNYLKEAMNG